MKSSLADKVKGLSGKYFEKVKEYREHLHQNPELSWKEQQTSLYIQEILKGLSIPFTLVSGHGITAILKGKKAGAEKVIAIRGEMDALPIEEKNTAPYKSRNEGVMHACGHDVHTSCVLGAAHILSELTEHFSGKIKLIFQPAEEKLPSGAEAMIKEGILENPKPDVIFAQHVFPELEAGKVGFREGKYMASSDEVYITIKGKGGHAAMPHQNIDPIVISAQLITALQQLVSRNSSPLIPTVLSFGKIEGGTVNNVIPDEVKLSGTFRTMDEKWRETAHKKITSLSEELCKSMGGTCEVKIIKGTPCVYNDENLTRKFQSAAIEYLGKENVIDLDLRMTSEDFAFFSLHLPSCFYRLGVKNESLGITSSVHTSTFDIDPEALKTGMGLMAWLSLSEFN